MNNEPTFFSFEDKERLIAWLSKERDPDVWGAIVTGMNFDHPYTLDYCKWVVQQPECDVATAVSLLSLTYGYQLVIEPMTGQEVVSLEQEQEIADIIYERAELGTFKRNEIGRSGVNLVESISEITSWLDERATVEPHKAAVLKAFFQTEFAKSNRPFDYFVDETGIYHRNYFDERMQKILFDVLG